MMKKITVSTLALAVALGTAVPVAAQQTVTRLEGESAMEMAERLGRCGASTIDSAEFVDDGSVRRLQVICASGGAGGLGTEGAIGAGLGLAALIGLAASDSDSTSSTTSTTSTTSTSSTSTN